MKNILDYFQPGLKPRPNQIAALEWAAKQDAKYLFIEAPVGTGKSHIGVTYSRFISHNGRGNSFILTPQRILQEQYEKAFVKLDLCSLYGKANYHCKTKDVSCEIGSLLKPRCSHCVHTAAKDRATASPNTVLNYKLALTTFGYTDTFSRRELMILDECHTVEEHLCDFKAVAITRDRSTKVGVKFRKFADIHDGYNWIKEEYYPKLNSYVQQMFNNIEHLIDKGYGRLTRGEVNKLRAYHKWEEHMDTVAEFVYSAHKTYEEDYVMVEDGDLMKMKMLTGAKNFKEFLEPMAEKFLFMSSTILDYESFCRDLGIDPKDAAYINLQSEFPEEHRPIFYMPQMKMNAGWNTDANKTNRIRMKNKVGEILKMHENDSGVIHTANFQVAQWMIDIASGYKTHKVFHHQPGSDNDRNEVIANFQMCEEPAVLISPSITEGLDLVDDLARFAIFAKVGFPYLGDQWIKRRMELSNAWYMRQTLISVIQGGGRVVRSDTDWGNVYILDSSFEYLRSKTTHYSPHWWKTSIVTV